MGHDDLMLASALKDLIHRRVDTVYPRGSGLRAFHAFIVCESLTDSRRWDESHVQPLLRSSLGLTVGLFPQPAVQDRF
jgi:hypothetical protein